MKHIILTILTFLFLEGNTQAQKKHYDFPKIQKYYHQLVDEGKLAGTAMLIEHQGKIYQDVYGMSNIAQKKALKTNHLFRMASMTKPIVSVGVMMLYEEGKIKLDDPVSKFIPEFAEVKVFESGNTYIKPKREITIKDLLSHTSGLSSGSFDNTLVGEAYRKAFAQPSASLKELVLTLTSLPLKHQPGEDWTYSYSTDVLGYVIEVVSGQSLNQFLKERVFKPLKMEDTDYKVSSDKKSRLTGLYGLNKEGQLHLLEDETNSSYIKDGGFARGNTGLVSTITDYYHFAKMLLNKGKYDSKQILKAETIALMTQNHLPESLVPIKVGNVTMENHGFGLGFGVLTAPTAFGGKKGDYFWMGAAFTVFFVSPDEELIGIFMAQYTDLSKLAWMQNFHGMAHQVFTDKL